MKRFSFIMMLFAATTTFAAEAGYAIFGPTPTGFRNRSTTLQVHNTSETFSGSPLSSYEYTTPSSTISFSGSDLPGRICENKADLLLRFGSNQSMDITEDMSIHVFIRRTNAGTNPVQMSFCRTKWNDSRMSWIIDADHLYQGEYIEVVLPYSKRNTDNWNSSGENAMLGTGVTYHGGTFSSESRDLFRFCAAAGEEFEISQIFISNSSMKKQSMDLGVLRVQNLQLYRENSTFDPKTTSPVEKVTLLVVSLDQQVYAKMKKGEKNFDSGFMDQYQVRTWKLNQTENMTLSATEKSDSEVLFKGNALFGIGAENDCFLSVRAKVWGYSTIVCSQKLPFRGTYVNTPTGDVTAPTASASNSYDELTGKYSVTITGSDDSGDVFYYVENVTKSSKQVSMVPTFEVTGEEGDHVQCYAIDFDGNMSEPVEVVLGETPCENCFQVTIR